MSIKVWYKQYNNNPKCMDAKTCQGLLESYWATTWSIIKCKKSKLKFSDSCEWWYISTNYPDQ